MKNIGFFFIVILILSCFINPLIIHNDNEFKEFITRKGFKFLAVIESKALDTDEIKHTDKIISQFTNDVNYLYYKVVFYVTTVEFLRSMNRRVPVDHGIFHLDKNSNYIKCNECFENNSEEARNDIINVKLLFEFLEKSKYYYFQDCDFNTLNRFSDMFYLAQDSPLEFSSNIVESLEKLIVYRKLKDIKENKDLEQIMHPYFMKRLLIFVYTKTDQNLKRIELLKQSENYHLYYHIIFSSHETLIKHFEIEENGYEAMVLNLKFSNDEKDFIDSELIQEVFKFEQDNSDFIDNKLLQYYNSPIGTLNYHSDRFIKSGSPTAFILTENSFKEDIIFSKEIAKAAILERKNISVIAVDNLKKLKYDYYKLYVESMKQEGSKYNSNENSLVEKLKENTIFFNKYLDFYLNIFDVKMADLPLLLIIKSEIITENNKQLSRFVRYKKSLKKKISQVEFTYMINLSNCQDDQRFYKTEKTEIDNDVESNLNEHISNISNLEGMIHEDKLKNDTYSKEEFEEFKNTAIEISKQTKNVIAESFGFIMNIEQLNTKNLYNELAPSKITHNMSKNKNQNEGESDEKDEVSLQQKHYKKFYDKIENKSKPVFKILMVCGTSYECTNLSLILTYFKLNFITKKYEFINDRYPELIPSLDLNYEFNQIKIYKFNPHKNEHIDLKFKNTPSIFIVNPLGKIENIKVFSSEIINKLIKKKKIKSNNKSEFSLDEDKTKEEDFILIDKNLVLEQMNLEAKSFFEKAIKNLNKDELEKEDKKLLMHTDNKLRAKIDFNKINWKVVHQYTRSFNEFLSITELDFDMDDTINKNIDEAISDTQVSILNRKVKKKDEHNTLDDDEEGYKEGMNSTPQVDHTEVQKTFEYPALAIFKLIFQNYNNFKKKVRTHIVNFANNVKVKSFEFGVNDEFKSKDELFTVEDTNINDIEKNINLKNELIQKLSSRYNEMLNNLASDVQSYLAKYVDLEGLSEIKKRKEEQAKKEKAEKDKEENQNHETEDL